MAGKGGGAWKVAYADFVTAMMAFFLVMWLVGQDKDVKEAVAQYFRDPFAIPSDSPGTRAPGPTFMPHESTAPLPPAGDGGDKKGGSGEGTNKRGPQTVIRRPSSSFMYRDGSRSSVGTHLPFGAEGEALDDEAKKNLAELIPMLVGKRNLLEIRASVSERPLEPGSKYADRWQLAYARCAATRKYLIDAGVEPDRIRMSQAGGSRTGPEGPDSPDAKVEVYMLDEFASEPNAGTPAGHASGDTPWQGSAGNTHGQQDAGGRASAAAHAPAAPAAHHE